MFMDACAVARTYTFPYAGLRRKNDGHVFSTVAAFILVNEEGWCITARHVFDEIAKAEQSVAGSQSVRGEIEALETSRDKGSKKWKRERSRLEKALGNSLSDHAEIWAAGDGWNEANPQATEVVVHKSADIAAFKLSPFTPLEVYGYPVFRSAELMPGLSICRIGYPWHSVQAEFGEGGFAVLGGFPAPMFASEGIVSRFLVERTPDGAGARYIQTSSPGLRGQSGGPLFDEDGRVCGLQSSTTHLDLGFDARYMRDGVETIERQFLNVGQALHVSDVTEFLTANKIGYVTG